MNTHSPISQSGETGQNVPFGKVERQIARRYLGAKKSEGGVALIAMISFACIALAIASMISIMSIMNGFRDTVFELTMGSEGHIFVNMVNPQPDDASIEALRNKLVVMPGVENAFEFSENMSAVMANNRMSLGRVIGVSGSDLAQFPLISDNLQYGSLLGYGQGRGAGHQIAIGSQMALQLGVMAGDRVRIYTSKTRTSPMVPGGTPIHKDYTVGAIFETGLYETDLYYIYMDLAQSQLLFNEGKRSGEIQLRLTDPDNVDQFKELVKAQMDKPVWVRTWKDRNSTTAAALRTEQIAMRLIFTLVVIISTFPVLATMIMLVKNKARDIAIIRTIGGTRGTVLRIFFIAGTAIGVFGTLAGLVLGLLFCLNIGIVQAAIEGITGQPLFPPDIYKISTGIPVKVVPREVIAVALSGFVISAIATIFPAIGAAKTDPVEALRYE